MDIISCGKIDGRKTPNIRTMLVSFLIPTRGRLSSLIEGIQSIKEKASPEAKIEFLVRADEDDAETLAGRNRIIGEVLVGPRWCGYNSVYRFYNELAAKSIGDWLVLWNDDTFMKTRDWDRLLPSPDRAQVIWLHSPTSCTWAFPAMSRKLYELWGCFAPSSPADTIIFELWRQAGKPLPDPNDHSGQIVVDHRRDEKQMLAMGLRPEQMVNPPPVEYNVKNMIERLRIAP